jgi:drug/metabolite transporter (DMT)-like permease
MLVVVTLLWGMSFVLVKNWQVAAKTCPGGTALASLTLIGIRMALALAVLAIFQRRLFAQPSLQEHRAGLLIGIVFFGGFALQTIGLAGTTPALSAFVTSLASAWVPLIAWGWFKIKLRWVMVLGIALGIMGTGVLSISGDESLSWGRGEALTLAASAIFAVEILMLDRLGRSLHSPHLTASFMTTSGSLAIIGALAVAAIGAGFRPWVEWTLSMVGQPGMLFDLALLTIFSTVLAFHWMNVYQPRVTASRAALIYLLEPVFGSIFSVAASQDELTMRLLVGGGLILAGNLLVELPMWKGVRECRDPK